MESELLKVFEGLTTSVSYDKKMIKRLGEFITDFQLARDKSQFFGSNLFGTVKVFFTDTDSLELHTILGVSRNAIQRKVKDVECINQEFKRESDETNLLLLYTAHRLFINTSLSLKDRYTGAATVIELYYMRQYAILMSKWLVFTTSEEIAKQVYESLSNKFRIRQFGTWGVLISYYGKAFVADKGRANSLLAFKCTKVKDDISAIRGAVASIIHGIYDKTVLVTEEQSRIITTSLIAQYEDGDAVADKINNQTKHIDNIRSLVGDGDIYNRTILSVVTGLIASLNGNKLKHVIKTISSKKFLKKKTKHKMLREAVTASIILADTRLKENGIQLTNVGFVLKKLKQYLISSTNDTSFHESRNQWKKLLEKENIHLSTKQTNVVIAGIQLYFYIMAIR